MFVEYFYNPEKLLRLRLSKNPVYPFTVLEPNVYVLSDTPERHITARVICVVVLIATVLICLITWHISEYVVIAILIFLYFMPQMFAIRGPRRLVIDFNQYSYEYYVNNDLVYRGHCHNIYVRVAVVKVAGEGYYKVVLGGYGIDTYDVTHLSKQPQKLFHLGRTIALNTGLNYFDFDDISTRHMIRHRCAHGDNTQNMEN